MDNLIKIIIILYKQKYEENPPEEKIQEIFKEIVNKSKIDQQDYLNKIFKIEKINYVENEVIDFITIVKNGEFYYTKVFPKIYDDLNKNLNVRFFIYENNSTDKTKDILRGLQRVMIILLKSNLKNNANCRITNIKCQNNLKKF